MKNVIYTGNYSINWFYFQGLQKWQIKNLYKLQQYADKHDADLKVIDNTSAAMNNVFNYTREKYPTADGWSLGTLTSIVALEEFEKSKYDNFLWMDLDICIIKPWVNAFDFIKDGLTIHWNNYTGTSCNGCKERIRDYLGVPHKRYCNTSSILLNKASAKRLVQNFEKHGISMSNYDFLDKMVEVYRGHPGYLIDESIIEVPMNSMDDLQLHHWPDELSSQVIIPGDEVDYNLHRFSYHFASSTKTMIEDFWKRIEV